MLGLLLAALLAPCGSMSAAELIQLGLPAAPRPISSVYGSGQSAWRSLPGGELSSFEARYGSAGLAPILSQLEVQGLGPQTYMSLLETQRIAAMGAAIYSVHEQARAEAAALPALIASADPARPDFPLTVARLQMLQGALGAFLEPGQLADARKAYVETRSQLDAVQQEKLSAAIARTARALGKGAEPVSVLEAVAAQTPELPISTPKIARLRQAARLGLGWEAGLKPVPSPNQDRSLGLRAKVAFLKTKFGAKAALARGFYRPLLDAFRFVMTHAGELYRKYISGQEMDRHSFRWHVLENLHKEGDFRGSFGHPVHEMNVEVESPVIFREGALEALRSEQFSLGGARLSSMLSISGMSYPQLSAQSHLSLMYIHLRLAKELGVRQFYNTGEGGPYMHLALLEGNRELVKERIIAWNKENKQFQSGSWDEAKVDQFVDQLMAKRDEIFKGFTQQDLEKAQIVAQFGSALNGIRDAQARVDFEKLRAIGASPYVAMIQYKLKQAAKRGAKVDARKIDAVVAAFRDLPRDGHAKSPELNPDFASYADIAKLILATKSVTHKPVSLKFGVGSAKDVLDFFQYLKSAGALPDHLQIDGRGADFSPGSGNAPPGANTSLPSNEAIIVIDAVLKKLGIRDRILVEATGDVLLPVDGVEKLALGADCISGARTWMGMGLGCAMVRTCANGNCPYGIASRADSLVGLGLDPAVIGPKGYQAAANWYKTFAQTLAEAGAGDWRDFRKDNGLGSRSAALRIQIGGKMVTLDEHFDEEYVANLLRGALTPEEVARYVFGR
jgi:glutamate synthase domain-containing protein 2